MERAIALSTSGRAAMTAAAHTVAASYYAPRVAEQVEAFYDDVLSSVARRPGSAKRRS
jgi:hypothetical protein